MTHSCAIMASAIAKSPINCGDKGVKIDEETEDILDLKKRLRNTIESLIWAGYTHFLTSATRGIEMWAAEAILALQEEYPETELEIVVPHLNHSAKWEEEEQNRYAQILARATKVTKLKHYSKRASIFGRNRYLLDSCSTILASYYEGSLTESIVIKARWNGKQIVRLPFVKPESIAA